MNLRLNIVLKPPQDIAKKAIDLSHKISKDNEVFFALDGLKFYPHITIYASEFSEINLKNILKAVESISNNTSPIKLKFQGISSSQGFISLKFDSSFFINNLHKEIIKKLNPLSEKSIRNNSQQFLGYLINFTPEQSKNIINYGYPDAIELYSPHLTLSRFKKESLTDKALKDIKWDTPEAMVDKIAIYLMGEHGTCRELVGEFNLR